MRPLVLTSIELWKVNQKDTQDKHPKSHEMTSSHILQQLLFENHCMAEIGNLVIQVNQVLSHIMSQ